jgi:hypothetical protein
LDYVAIYDQETYLFETVHSRFHGQGFLSAFDFFCIIIWKANRAKSKIAKRLLTKGHDSLDSAVYDLTAGIHRCTSSKERLRHLWDSGFYLPMASAILTVLYPDEFSIYDVRVCGELSAFSELSNITKFEKLWPRYLEFLQAVEKAAPDGLMLRDKDRYLWGKSFSNQLTNDIKQKFTSFSEVIEL